MAIDVSKTVRKYLQRAISMLPIDITYDGRVYSGTKTSRKDETELRVAGLLPGYTYSVYLDKAGLHATPAVGETVIIDDTTYRILELGLDPADAYIRLDLGHKYATRSNR